MTSTSIATRRPSLVTPVRCRTMDRMAFGRRQHVFRSVIHDFDRPSGLERQQRRVSRDHRRVLLLAAESAAGLGLNHANVRIGSQEALEGLHHIVRTLNRAVDCDAAVLGDRDDAVRFDVDVLLMPGAIRALDDKVRTAECRLDVAFVDRRVISARSASVQGRALDSSPRIRRRRLPAAGRRDSRGRAAGWAPRRAERPARRGNG